MGAYQVTVTRTLTMLVGRSPGPESAEEFVRGLLDAGQVSEDDWDQDITVEELPPGALSVTRHAEAAFSGETGDQR